MSCGFKLPLWSLRRLLASNANYTKLFRLREAGIECLRHFRYRVTTLLLAFTFCLRTRRLFRIMTILWKNVSSPPGRVNFFRLKRTVRRLHDQSPALKPGFNG